MAKHESIGERAEREALAAQARFTWKPGEFEITTERAGEGDEMANPLEELPAVEDELDALEDEIGDVSDTAEVDSEDEAQSEPA